MTSPRNLLRLLILTIGCTVSSSFAFAQATPDDVAAEIFAISTASANDLGPPGLVPSRAGFNASLVSGSQYDSAAGWSSILTPDLALRFNRFISIDFAAPVYLYFLASINTGTKAKPVYTVEPRHFSMGDSSLAGHLDLSGDIVSYSLTLAAGLPTGNSTYGLGADQFTYNFNNHFDFDAGHFSPDIEIGFTDTSLLLNQRLKRGRAFVSTGNLAHFQAGSSFDLPRHCSLNADAYEDMPIGHQQVTGTKKTKKGVVGRSGRRSSTTQGPAEDNGIYTSLDMPVGEHLVLSGLYSYSVRQSDVTSGFSLTYLLHGSHPAEP